MKLVKNNNGEVSKKTQQLWSLQKKNNNNIFMLAIVIGLLFCVSVLFYKADLQKKTIIRRHLSVPTAMFSSSMVETALLTQKLYFYN